MKEDILYLVDNEILIYSHKKKKTYNLVLPKKILLFGKVANPQKFYDELKSYLEKEKIFNYFLMSNIKIIVNDYFTKADKYILNELLNKIGYKKITYINEKNLLKVKNKVCYVNINKEYILIYYKNNFNKLTTIAIFKNTFDSNDLINYIKKNFPNYSVFLLGNAVFDTEKTFYVYQSPKTLFLDILFKL